MEKPLPEATNPAAPPAAMNCLLFILFPHLDKFLEQRVECSSVCPDKCNRVFLQLLEADQIGIPIFLRWHIRFRPARPSEVREGFSRMPLEDHQGMIRGSRC